MKSNNSQNNEMQIRGKEIGKIYPVMWKRFKSKEYILYSGGYTLIVIACLLFFNSFGGSLAKLIIILIFVVVTLFFLVFLNNYYLEPAVLFENGIIPHIGFLKGMVSSNKEFIQFKNIRNISYSGPDKGILTVKIVLMNYKTRIIYANNLEQVEIIQKQFESVVRSH